MAVSVIITAESPSARNAIPSGGSPIPHDVDQPLAASPDVGEDDKRKDETGR